MKEAGFFPHTSQSGSAFKEGRCADAADECAETKAEEEAEAEAETEAEAEAAAAAVEGGVGGGARAQASAQARRSEAVGVVNDADGTSSVGGDGLLAAPAFFPRLFFGIVVVCVCVV